MCIAQSRLSSGSPRILISEGTATSFRRVFHPEFVFARRASDSDTTAENENAGHRDGHGEDGDDGDSGDADAGYDDGDGDRDGLRAGLLRCMRNENLLDSFLAHRGGPFRATSGTQPGLVSVDQSVALQIETLRYHTPGCTDPEFYDWSVIYVCMHIYIYSYLYIFKTRI